MGGDDFVGFCTSDFIALRGRSVKAEVRRASVMEMHVRGHVRRRDMRAEFNPCGKLLGGKEAAARLSFIPV